LISFTINEDPASNANVHVLFLYLLGEIFHPSDGFEPMIIAGMTLKRLLILARLNTFEHLHTSWTTGECRIRKRYWKKHPPLVQTLYGLLNDPCKGELDQAFTKNMANVMVF
jgi:hypothetical protein